MFENQSENKWIEKISEEVSALANTEGGQLFLGIDEDKRSKPRVATGIDGAPVALAPERLQQLIEGNVSPYLPGIRVQRVLLSKNPNRVVFVIQIPQGRRTLLWSV
jgi:predicted HTH transcriptional regulator